MNEIARVEHSSAAFLDITTAATNLTALKMRHNLLVEAMKDVLTDGKDYGKIPGTGDKPTLLKPGAENLCFLFGLRPSFEVMDSIEDWDKGLFYYRYRCTLSGGDGRIVANSEGSCNSKETKYRYRNAKSKCPSCGAESISKSKYPPRDNPTGTPGWYCRDCKAQYPANDKQITGQDNGKVENTEPFELINTIQKMAQKRALVAAVLIGTGASQFFTQDVEDMTTITIDAEVVEVKQAARAPRPEDSISMDTVEEISFDDTQPSVSDNTDYIPRKSKGITRPADPDIVKGWMAMKAKTYVAEGKTANPAQRGLLAGVLEECFAGSTDSKQDRHFVQEYLTGYGSLNDVPDSFVLSLLDWLKPVRADGGAYVADGNAVIEAGMIRNAAMEAAGQTRLI